MVKFLFNKYFLTMLFFVVWLLFFDKNDVFTQMDLNKQVKKLSDEKKYYRKEIQKNQELVEDFKNNIESIDKFAREQYWMKKDNEDVYVVLKRK